MGGCVSVCMKEREREKERADLHLFQALSRRQRWRMGQGFGSQILEEHLEL